MNYFQKENLLAKYEDEQMEYKGEKYRILKIITARNAAMSYSTALRSLTNRLENGNQGLVSQSVLKLKTILKK